jgi:hypothetical protein
MSGLFELPLGEQVPISVEDPQIENVEAALYRHDPAGDRVARVLRRTLDQLYDGQHTGRWSYDQLMKTEKTHMGTLVEINLQREFEFSDGTTMDYSIAGVEVDCKYSMKMGGWQIPPEAIGHVVLVVWASEQVAQWKAGLIRVAATDLNLGTNRDSKKTLNKAAVGRIHWLWHGHGRLTPNLFYQLDASTRERIFNAKARRGNQHGQARVNELFRSVQRRIVRRAELATVAQQDDFMKRARNDGGAREKLRPEGILVLGHQQLDRMIAEELGIPVPTVGEFVSVRVVPHTEGSRSIDSALIDGCTWRMATSMDQVVPAPNIDRRSSNGRSE